jgi:hypothetical protein
MDPNAVRERARVSRQHGDLLPNAPDTDGETWVAVDPETGCRGVGGFEAAARTNLVYAVEAYEEEPSEVGYISAGPEQTFEMAWLRDTSIGGRIRDLLPF